MLAAGRLAILAAMLLQCGNPLADYDILVAEARRCAPEERCLVAGGVKGCRCPVAVRAPAKARVDEAAQSARCPQVERLYCPPLERERCEHGICVADQVRP